MKNELIELFNSTADKYDEYFNSSGILIKQKRIIDKLTKYIHNKSVIDFGTGTGELIIYISKKTNKKVVGIDFSPKMIKIAQKKTKIHNIKNLFFKVSDIKSLSKKDKFNTVVCSFFLGYLQNKHLFLNKIKDICKNYLIIIGSIKKDNLNQKKGRIRHFWKINYHKLEENLFKINFKRKEQIVENDIFAIVYKNYSTNGQKGSELR